MNDGYVGSKEGHPDSDGVDEREDHPRGKQTGGAQIGDGVEAHDFKCVDLVVDAHGAKLGHDAGADLGRHHVAERVGNGLA